MKKFNYRGRIIEAATKEQAVRRILAARGNKLVCVFTTYKRGAETRVAYCGWLAKLVSDEKLAALTDKSKGYGCTTQLRLAKRLDEASAEKAVATLKDITTGFNYLLVDAADEEKRQAEQGRGGVPDAVREYCEKN